MQKQFKELVGQAEAVHTVVLLLLHLLLMGFFGFFFLPLLLSTAICRCHAHPFTEESFQ